MNSVQIRSAETALSVGSWLIVAGAMLYSILTVTPLMAAHTAPAWRWTAPILPLVVDAAVVIVVRLDSVLARLGGHGGRWPVVLRWMTGAMTLALNTGDAALQGDLVGMAIHAVAPLLLIVTAEAGLAYRRAITAAVHALEKDAQEERERRERVARERAEAVRAQAREEREHAAQLAREQREHEARLAREAGEREDRQRAEEQARIAAAEQAERAERERRERAREQSEREREQRERQAAERAEKQRRDAAERAAREHREREERAERERAELLARGPATEKLAEDEARSLVGQAFALGLPVRAAAELSGWSVGWVSNRYAEQRPPRLDDLVSA
ncbi:DUF2637 domain-containing protein [Streptomyces sp. NPDC004111]|uniref:DUF2637 domain-containing protein n=1 Tax=Streptomyces sp. NPDC004111 TaxID=3364690 RepID=UPI003676270B